MKFTGVLGPGQFFGIVLKLTGGAKCVKMVRTPVGRKNNATEGPHASPILREADPGGRKSGCFPKGWNGEPAVLQRGGRRTGRSPKGRAGKPAVLRKGWAGERPFSTAGLASGASGEGAEGGAGQGISGLCVRREVRPIPEGEGRTVVYKSEPRAVFAPVQEGRKGVHRQEDVGVVARVSLCKESSSGHLWFHGRNGQSRSWRPNGYGSISGGLRMWAEAVRLAIHMSEVPVLLGDSHVRSSRPTRTTSPPPRSATTFKPFPPPRNASRTGLWTGPRTPGPASGPAPPSSPAKGKRNK